MYELFTNFTNINLNSLENDILNSIILKLKNCDRNDILKCKKIIDLVIEK